MEKKSFTYTFPRLANRIITPITLVNPATGETFEVRALWDTGASSSAISIVAAEFLRLKKVGFTFRTPPGGVIDFTKPHKVSGPL